MTPPPAAAKRQLRLAEKLPYTLKEKIGARKKKKRKAIFLLGFALRAGGGIRFGSRAKNGGFQGEEIFCPLAGE